MTGVSPPRARVACRLSFVPNDCWVGVYWRWREDGASRTLHLYVCLVPALPLHISVTRADPARGTRSP